LVSLMCNGVLVVVHRGKREAILSGVRRPLIDLSGA
jgi:hypothetical protein